MAARERCQPCAEITAFFHTLPYGTVMGGGSIPLIVPYADVVRLWRSAASGASGQ